MLHLNRGKKNKNKKKRLEGRFVIKGNFGHAVTPTYGTGIYTVESNLKMVTAMLDRDPLAH